MEILAVCHVHSEWSYDGSWALQALSEKFRRRGCRVLMMTEHDRGFTTARFDEYREACAKASSDEILVVPGIEYSDAANRVHVLVWGRLPFLGEGLPTGELLEAAHSAGGVAVLAHPSRRDAWKTFEASWASRLLGIEIWNRKYDGWAPSKTAPALLQATGAIPFVGLDFHTERQSFPLGMKLEIPVEVSESTVLGALSARRCSPVAFGLPLGQKMARSAIPVLRLAEQSRRLAASLLKKAKRHKL